MKEEHSSTVLTVAITGMASAGIISPFIGLKLGVLLLPLAAITQRGRLARSMDAVDAS